MHRLPLMRSKVSGLICAGAAAWACGRFVHPDGYVAMCAVIAILFIGLIWPWITLRPLSANLSFSEARCTEGQPVVARLVIKNGWPMPVWGVRLDGLQVESDVGGWLIPTVRALGKTTICQPFTPLCRGEYPRTEPRLVCAFPFGLWRPTKTVIVGSTLLSWPSVVPVAPLGRVRQYAPLGGYQANRSMDSGEDVVGVREYRRGDRLRHVHWTQTARQERLIVRETRPLAQLRARILVVVSDDAYADLSPTGPRECAIRVAASLFLGWLEQGANVGLDVGRQSFPIAVNSSAHRQRVMDALARVPSDGSAMSWGDPHIRQSNNALTVVVASDRWIESMQPGKLRSETRFVSLPAEWKNFESHLMSGSSAPSSCWIDILSPSEVESKLSSV